MKKVFGFIAMALALVACNKNETIIPEGIPFSATISMDNSTVTKALAESGSDIVATWADGEQVALIYDAGGMLTKTPATVTKQLDGSATISATLEAGATDGSDVTIIYPASAVDGATGEVLPDLLYAQDGTLTGTSGTSIAEKYDVREGAGKLSISGGKATVNNGTAGTAVTLTNKFAIFKFTTKNTDGSATIKVTSLTITIGAQEYEITHDATSELFVVLPAVSGKTVSFVATGDDSNTYMASKAGISFAAGNYYQSAIKMTQAETFNVSTADVTIPVNGYGIITGSYPTNEHNIIIRAGATAVLDGVNINSNSYCIRCEGSATIILKAGSENMLVSTNYSDRPAIWAGDEGTTLTILGSGELDVTSGRYCAGIGGGYSNTDNTCGNIVIEGGVITVQGGEDAAGIGSEEGGTCGDITITGGTITATGGENGAGIGSGPGFHGPSYSSSCGNIIIANTVTRVTAIRDSNAWHSIGSSGGPDSSCGTVTIGGTVYWDGSHYQNGGGAYLIQDTITYPAP